MTASSLNGRRCCTALPEERDAYEGTLALGLPVPVAARLVISRHRAEALVPGLDQTRTVGLVPHDLRQVTHVTAGDAGHV
jgi:putative ABC transport system permease protein